MTHPARNTAIEQVLEEIIANGMQGLETAVSLLINEAMKVERSRVPGAEPWQRNDQRRGHANGSKPFRLNSRMGCDRRRYESVFRFRPGASAPKASAPNIYRG